MISLTDPVQRKVFNDKIRNRAIFTSGVGARSGFSCLMTNQICDIQLLDNGQCYPLRFIEKQTVSGTLFENKTESESPKDAVTNQFLKKINSTYNSESISEEDVFYYIYGLLHSDDYRERFSNNLVNKIPRIPLVSTKMFTFLCEAGKLGDLHCNFDCVENILSK